MPSHLHEGLLDLVRARPRMLLGLLEPWLGRGLGRRVRLRVEPADLAETRPAEYRADLVLTLGAPRPALAIVLEVQLRRRASKRRAWPAYATAVGARFRCPVALVVLCVDEATARWASRPIEIGPPANAFRAIVIGPQGVPPVLEPREAAQAPELAVLGALANAKGPQGLRAAMTAVTALEGLDAQRARYYYALICQALPAAARAALEKAMLKVDPRLDTPMVRKVLAIGRKEGRAEGRAEGREEGMREARVEARREALLALLRARGLRLDARMRAGVEACDDVALLDVWIRRAATEESARDVLGSKPARGSVRRRNGRAGRSPARRSEAAARTRVRRQSPGS
jgi:hypothetical protein